MQIYIAGELTWRRTERYQKFQMFVQAADWKMLALHSHGDFATGREVDVYIFQTEEMSETEILLLKLQWPVIGAVAEDGEIFWPTDDFNFLKGLGRYS